MRFLLKLAVLGLVLILGSCGGGDGGSGPTPPPPPAPPPPPPPPPPAPVASVTVAPDQVELLVGATRQLTATLRDGAGNVLSGRAVAWASSNQGIATVSATGLVTAVALGGPVTIAATSEGRTGSALVTVLAPVASVVITGATRAKVGDSYQYSATARTADGTVVTRAAMWSVAEPERATMTPGGVMTPLQTGAITLRVTIDGVVWIGQATAYDWFAFGGGSTFGVALDADLQITNKFGTSEYPSLTLGCSGGFFLIFVDTEHFVTESGLVAYAFDGQDPEGATWLEFDLFSALAHPGPDGATRIFGNRMAGANRFEFAFNEFNGPAQAMLFRVTGLAAQMPAFATCPAGSPPAAGTASVDGPAGDLLSIAGRRSVMTAERRLREVLWSSRGEYPVPRRGGFESETQPGKQTN